MSFAAAHRRDRVARVQSSLPLRQRRACVLELLPLRCVFEGLVVFDERLFRVTLLHEHVTLSLERIGPVRPALIGVLELHRSTIEIPVLRECDALRVVTRSAETDDYANRAEVLVGHRSLPRTPRCRSSHPGIDKTG